MPQTPGPQDLGGALGRLAERCDAAVESLLLAMPVAGDLATQRTLEACLDQTMDTLRMVAVTGREIGAQLAPGPRVRSVERPALVAGRERSEPGLERSEWPG